MKPERWQQVEAIFQAAIDVDLEDRAHLLDEECGGDTLLRSEVEKLLKNFENAEGFIEDPVWSNSKNVDQQKEPKAFTDVFSRMDSSELIGRRIGVFELTKEIGRGGMGTVYLARRADGEFNQNVAVKLIRRGMDSDFIIRRFRHERQILASFDHPYISRLIDGGRTSDGLPYFVMEFVQGDSVYEYCDGAKLNSRQRIKLFRQICSAVSYAHERQIIHRDIKPGNILVTKGGIPKLLDFGIAKILDSELIHESDSPTSSFIRMMTPDYASPEQLSGKGIAGSSDIYSLGVLLYELLTGHKPHDFSDLPLHEISRVVCEEMPLLPSAAVGSKFNMLAKYDERPSGFAEACGMKMKELVAALEGQIDHIVMKALAKDPAARYQTVDEFSEDLQAVMHNKPLKVGGLTKNNFVGRSSDPLKFNSESRSLAVLPFKYFNLGRTHDTNEDFLALGLADALITRLSKIRKFTVRSTSSIQALQGTDVDPLEAGISLNADYVLAGSIKRADDILRVTVQLLDVVENSAVWAASFDETISDIFALEDSIATKVVEGMLPEITGVELKDYSNRGTDNPDAFEHCLRGRYFMNSGTEEGLAKAFVCFHQSIASDPDYSNAYVGLSDYYNFLGIFGVLPPGECFAASIEAATRAVELDGNSAQAHATLGFAVHAGRYDWSKAEYHLGRALELNPNYATAYTWFAIVRYTQGKFSIGLELARRAAELDPLAPFNHHNIGWGLIFARRFEESAEQYEKVISHFPKYGLGYYGLSIALRLAGRSEEALFRIQECKKYIGDTVFVLTAEAKCYAESGNESEARILLDGLVKKTETRYVSPYHMATVHCCLREREAALDLLENAWEMKDPWLNWLGVEPVFDFVREEERFQALQEKLGYQFFFNDPTLHENGLSRNTGLIEFNTSETMLLDQNHRNVIPAAGKTKPHISINKRLVAYAALITLLIVGSAALVHFWVDGNRTGGLTRRPELNPNSIVILPFESENPSDENLGIGLADALSGRLGYIKRLSVISPNSGRIIAKENAGAKSVESPARYILRGRISRRGEKHVSVEANLQTSDGGIRLWSDTFESDSEDFISIQKRLAEKIWTSMRVDLLPTELIQMSKVYTKKNSAYELYLIGRFLMTTRSPENLKKAVSSFTDAAEEDPEFALAYAGLADAHTLLNLYEIPVPAGAFQTAKAYAEKALALDENLAEAHTSLAYIRFYAEKDRQGAELGFRRALQLNPSYSQAHHWFAIVLMAMNRPLDAIDEMRTAEQLDPRSLIVRTAVGMMFVYNKQYDEGLKKCNEVLGADPGFVPALKVKRWVHQAKGEYALARDAFRKERSYSGGDAKHPGWYVIEAQVEAMNRKKREVTQKLDNAVSDRQVSENPASYAYEIALAYNALGEKQKTVVWLEKGLRAGDNGVNMLSVDPRFENMRNDPRFRAIRDSAIKQR